MEYKEVRLHNKGDPIPEGHTRIAAEYAEGRNMLIKVMTPDQKTLYTAYMALYGDTDSPKEVVWMKIVSGDTMIKINDEEHIKDLNEMLRLGLENRPKD